MSLLVDYDGLPFPKKLIFTLHSHFLREGKNERESSFGFSLHEIIIINSSPLSTSAFFTRNGDIRSMPYTAALQAATRGAVVFAVPAQLSEHIICDFCDIQTRPV